MLTDAWGATFFSAYSCTEVRGEAIECPLDPTIYHPSPCMIAEVLDLRTMQPVGDGGVGEVALTGLYPFQSCMPMIRYRPGDLAQLFRRPCKCGSAAVELRSLGAYHTQLTCRTLPSIPACWGLRVFLKQLETFHKFLSFLIHGSLRRGLGNVWSRSIGAEGGGYKPPSFRRCGG